MKIKVLVVDDTISYRKIISNILAEHPDVEVVGTANNGKIALSRIHSLKPDLITLDVEMPEMNGLQLLEELQKRKLKAKAVMLSSKTEKGSEATIMSLQLGALDFILKPDEDSVEKNRLQLSNGIKRAIEVYKRYSLRGTASRTPPAVIHKVTGKLTKTFRRRERSHVVAIGISTGGPHALTKVLPQLPGDIGVPIFLVQHMPPLFTTSLAKSLNGKSTLKVKEAVNGEEVSPNTVYIAPGGAQMMVSAGVGLRKIIRVSASAPPENNCRPSVDYLFRSVAREYGSKSTCVVMTGMGTDGKLGLTVAKANGTLAIAQEETSCTIYGMPKAVIEAGLADIISPLDNIADEIVKTI